MHDRVRARAGKRGLNLLAVSQIALDELRAGVHSATMAFCQVIEDCSLMAFVKKQFCANAPDITGAANDENFHPAKYRRA
jgi:hypothetical protein